MLERMVRATKLDVDLYEEVEHDPAYTTEAGIIVAIVSLLGAIGAALLTNDSRIGAFIGALLLGLVGWLVWAAITDFVGRTLFDATSDIGEMLRVTGYAQSVRVLAIIPIIGWLAAIWSLVCMVVALRQGLDISTGKAILTAIIGWLVLIVAQIILFAIF
jgi:hypothetical protein